MLLDEYGRDADAPLSVTTRRAAGALLGEATTQGRAFAVAAFAAVDAAVDLLRTLESAPRAARSALLAAGHPRQRRAHAGAERCPTLPGAVRRRAAARLVALVVDRLLEAALDASPGLEREPGRRPSR